jgi:hypothetical protein
MPTTTTQTAPAPWFAPRLESLWNGASQIANQPYQQYMGPRVANMSDITQGALGGYQDSMYGNPTTFAGMGFLNDTISGKYGNPETDKMAAQITTDAGHAFDSKLGQLNSIFSNPNSFGSDRHALGASKLTEDFGRGLGASLGNLRYGAFNDDMSRRMGATGAAQSMTNSTLGNLAQGAQLGQIPRNIQQQVYDANYGDFQQQRQYPQQMAEFMARMYGMGTGYSSQSQQTPDPNRTSQALGGALMAAPWLSSLFSGGGQATPTQDLWMNGQPIGGFASDPWFG